MNPIQLYVAGREVPPSMNLSYMGHTYTAVSLGITLTQLNAGYNIIDSGHNCRVRIIDFFIRVNTDAIAAVTDVRLGSTEATPTVIATILQAVLTTGSRHTPLNGVGTDGVTPSLVSLGAGFAAKLAKGHGVKLYKTGSSATGSFTVDVILRYDVVN